MKNTIKKNVNKFYFQYLFVNSSQVKISVSVKKTKKSFISLPTCKLYKKPEKNKIKTFFC